MYENYISIIKTEGEYDNIPPFNPDDGYPEYPFVEKITSKSDAAYQSVRSSFYLLGLDLEHFGSKEWNPLGDLITPGQNVLIKPNLISEGHRKQPSEWKQIITHPSIIRAVLDYVFIALKGKGKVTIADGPQTDSDFDRICHISGLYDVVHFFQSKGLDIELLDLRRDRWFSRGDVIYKRVKLNGDPAGYTSINLGDKSEFLSYKLCGRFYGADYAINELGKYHFADNHIYILCKTPLDADVFINIPKMKTHIKTGVTLSLKNLVGINGYRNCLPHHTLGTQDQGGDEFQVATMKNKVQSKTIELFKRTLTKLGGTGGLLPRLIKITGKMVFGDSNNIVRSGNWYGNDTAWRMVLDLNKAFFYYNGDGSKREKPRKYMTIVDGIIAGEGSGPIEPDPINAGLIVAGFNPVAVDTASAILMGFDYNKIPMIANAWNNKDFPLIKSQINEIRCLSNIPEWNCALSEIVNTPCLKFKPSFGWKGHIEKQTI